MRLGKLTLSCAAILTLSSFGASQNPSAPAASTLKAYSRETVVDVTVTDAKGNPVRGLKPSDFTILEDGVPMPPGSFVEHRSDAPPATPATQAKQDLPRTTFTNLVPGSPSGGPSSLLVFDSFNTTEQEQQRLAKSMLEYIDLKPPGMQMAVFRLSDQISIVQGFTSDRNLLKAAITRKKLAAERPPVADDAVGGSSEATNASLRAQYALSAMRQIAGYLSGIPGRKNLIWFSGAFPPLFPPACPPNTHCDSRQDPAYDFTSDAGSVTNLLAGAHVVVYPIDSRGQETPGSTVDKMRLAEHSAMDKIAEQTGGHAFYNTSGFAQAVQQAVSSGSNFYTLTYTPTNQPADSRFRAITIKVNQSDVQLSYRDGYYALDPDDTSLPGVMVPHPTALQAAMLHGAPDANQILFDAKVVRAPVTDQTLPESNQRAGDMKPPYRRFDIDYTTHVDKIDFTKQPDGSYISDFEFVATVFDAATGQALNTTTKEVRPVITDSTYQSMLRDGAIAHQEIDVPAKGDYFLRIAVHDLNTERIGTVEMKTSAIAPANGSRGHAEDRGALASTRGQPKSDAATIQVYSRETVVDVTVADKDGNPVHGLARSAFTVKEDGKPQGIKSFEEFGTPSATLQAPPKLPPNVYTNLQPPPASSALNILLLDFVNTAPVLGADCCQITPCPFPPSGAPSKQNNSQSPKGPTAEQCSSPSAGPQEVARAIASQREVKMDAIKYLQHMPVGTRVEVIGMWWPGTLRILQGFTSDPALLSAAVNTMNYDTTSTVAVGSPDASYILGSQPRMDDEDGMGVLVGSGSLYEQICSQADGRDRMTLEVLQEVAANLSGIKGRKNLIWFTVGTPYITDPNTRPRCLPDYTIGLNRALSGLLAAQVALYPVDARGILTLPGDMLELSGKLVLNIPSLAPIVHSETMAQFSLKTMAEQLSMESWAEKTGGAAFYNTNDLAGALAKAIGKGANYYTLSYVPPGTKFDGRHHTIKVTVDQPNLSLVYRNGYTAEDPSSFQAAPSLTLAAAPKSESSHPIDMRTEMGRSLPTSQQVLFDVQVEPSTGPANPSDPQVIGVLEPKLRSKPLERYGFTYAIPGNQIAFANAANGLQHGSLEFDLAAYDSDGKVVTSLRQAIELNLSTDQVTQLDHTPFHYFQQIDLPAGQVFVRIGVLDRTSNKVGTLEIPLTVAKNPAPR